MRLTSQLAVMCLCLAPAASAQDVVPNYTGAFNSFVLPGSDPMDPDKALAAVIAVLPRLEGDWVRGDILAAGGPLLEADLVDRACERVFERLVLTGPQGFALQRIGSDGAVALNVRYDYVGLQNFQRSYDEAEWLAYLGFDNDTPVMASMFRVQFRGEVTLFVPAPGIMVIHDAQSRSEIYVRCP